MSAISTAKTTAAAMPPAVALRPPVVSELSPERNCGLQIA